MDSWGARVLKQGCEVLSSPAEGKEGPLILTAGYWGGREHGAALSEELAGFQVPRVVVTPTHPYSTGPRAGDSPSWQELLLSAPTVTWRAVGGTPEGPTSADLVCVFLGGYFAVPRVCVEVSLRGC